MICVTWEALCPKRASASGTSSVTSKPCGTKLRDPAAGASRPSPHRLTRLDLGVFIVLGGVVGRRLAILWRGHAENEGGGARVVSGERDG
eukprot:jgi/Chrpa1/24567/Chrysochromulina_OHIO_Genome00023058-RA